MTNIGLTINRLRKSLSLTQGAVADHLGLKTSAISAYEIGRAFPTVENAEKLEQLFGTDNGFLTNMLFENKLTENEAILSAHQYNTPLTAEAFAILKSELEFLRNEISEKNKELGEKNLEIAHYRSQNDKLLAKY